MATKKLILDLDMGVDDAMALAYAIASPEVELVGITTCFGNVRVEQSAHNCLAVLDLLGRPEVPVYLGADRPLQATEPYTPPASTRAHSRQERHRRRERARVALRAGGGRPRPTATLRSII